MRSSTTGYGAWRGCWSMRAVPTCTRCASRTLGGERPGVRSKRTQALPPPVYPSSSSLAAANSPKTQSRHRGSASSSPARRSAGSSFTALVSSPTRCWSSRASWSRAATISSSSASPPATCSCASGTSVTRMPLARPRHRPSSAARRRRRAHRRLRLARCRRRRAHRPLRLAHRRRRAHRHHRRLACHRHRHRHRRHRRSAPPGIRRQTCWSTCIVIGCRRCRRLRCRRRRRCRRHHRCHRPLLCHHTLRRRASRPQRVPQSRFSDTSLSARP